MDYIRNKRFSALNLILSLFVYSLVVAIFRFHINAVFLIISMAVFVLYYLSNIFSFDEKRNTPRSLLLTAIINLVSGIVFALLYAPIPAVILFAVIFTVTVAAQYILRRVVNRPRRILIVGHNDLTIQALDILKDRVETSYVKFLADRKTDHPACCGTYNEFWKILENEKITDIVVTVPYTDLEKILPSLFPIKIEGINVMPFIIFYETVLGKVPAPHLEEDWFFSTHKFSIIQNPATKSLKRLFDIFCGIVVLILLSPVMLLTAVCIKLESKGPAFFKQTRLGVNSRPFTIVKFRSMFLHDPGLYSRYATDNDPRITKVGKFMRKTRIDELPQLFNIIKGDMSFIGPRAEWDELCAIYRTRIPYYDFRHSIKPGATGWAQVNFPYGSSVEDAREKLKYDLYYIKHYTFFLDLLIILKTMKTVLFGRGK